MNTKFVEPMVCENCGRSQLDHRMANFSDGPSIGVTFLVCPTAMFIPRMQPVKLTEGGGDEQ